METKPGWKTTEFWKSNLVTAVGLGLVVMWALGHANEQALMVGAGMAGVSTGMYALSRGGAKKGE